MSEILITGGNGALGQAIISQLIKTNNFRVYTAGRTVVEGVHAHFPIDICDSTQMSTAFNKIKPRYVLHLAANFTGSLEEMYSVNVVAARQILDLAKSANFKTRILLTGSAAEYGAVKETENPIREDRILKPVSAYGVTKAWQTQLIGFYIALGVDVLEARIFNLAGAKISKNLFFGRITHQIEEILAGKKDTLEIGPLSAVRDYISIAEAAEQILAIMTNGVSGEIYHVASGAPLRMRDLLAQELSASNLDFSIVREAENNSNRSGYDVPAIYADVSKTQRLLNQNTTA
ncbi:NAD-dependent epimerase/dehydratase family protein [Variovorax sp. HJSM1_2]|uniref:NAD-dependent epimerase/dehydratase family protein n=1 Tax=Variovorax sp. HJSM1_2 TaxID=3366263 RepID=UPI003BCE9EF1